jgi:glutamyl-tRNA synthetase
MLRFAVNPTDDLHIEDLRIALFNYITANQKKENFLIRFEDIDKKIDEKKEQETLGILELFGITYSQVTKQSQNLKFHSAMALQLLHEKKAFACFCSDNWLENKKQEAEAANVPYHYDDACRNLPAELVIDNTNPFRIRIIRPDKAVVIDDIMQGKLSFDPNEVDSFTIMNQDKTPTYNFASAVDDMLNDISTILTNESNSLNSARQVHVRDSLGYDKQISYAHMPSLLYPENIPSVKELLELGFLPDAISNYLISLGNSVAKKVFTLNEAAEWFDVSNSSKSPSEFNLEALKMINKAHLRNMDAKELSRYVGFADAEIGELARIFLDETSTTVELRSRIKPIFEQRDVPSDIEDEYTLIIKSIKSAPYFEEYADLKAYITKETELEDEKIIQALRLLLTNAQQGPELSEIYKYLKNYLGEIIK